MTCFNISQAAALKIDRDERGQLGENAIIQVSKDGGCWSLAGRSGGESSQVLDVFLKGSGS